MHRLLLSFALILATLFPALAEEPRNPAIEATIQGQFDAFIASDLPRAFSFASPTIQGIFGSPENFGAMVQQGYPMVWRPGSVKYLGLRNVAGSLYQKVAITDQAGAIHVLEYEMMPNGDGWMIGGVQVLRQPDVGA